MKRNRLLLAVALITLSLAPLGTSQEDPIAAADRAILTEIADHSEQMENLEYLTHKIGSRLTGTEALKRANDWTAQRFRDYGLSNVHLESWSIAHSWQRGEARARVLHPAVHPLAVAAAGWSPNTEGTARGRLVYVEAEKKEDLESYRGKLQGAIIITAKPKKPQPEEERPLHPRTPKPHRDYATRMKFVEERDDFFRREGALAVLRDSDKEFGLFNMSSAVLGYKPSALPTAYLTPESYDLLWGLLENGEEEVKLELTIEGCAFSEGPVEVFNTVAEVPGSEKPEEVVILGAHLDSWDLATGATDNGTGVSVVLEAARVLRKLDLKPKRTLRFILFTGEEQGLNGARAYVEAHRDELPNISAVLVHDAGTGRVKTLALQGNAQVFDILTSALAPLREMIGLETLSLLVGGGSDHAAFDKAGVPGFFCLQEHATYKQTHHSQADTFDKVIADDVMNGAQVAAVFAYNVAQLDELLPRKPASESEPEP